MPLTSLKTTLAILLTFVAVIPHAISQVQNRKPTSSELCPDQKTYTGKYRNFGYGFSIIIPAGLKGYWNSAICVPDEKDGCVCMGDHGRLIPISDDASIDAYVGHLIESEWSVIDNENNEITDLNNEKGVEQVKVVSSKWFRLGPLNARRFSAQLAKENKKVVIDHIIALHKGVEYQLILRTTAKRYQRDKVAFEKVVASWRLTPRIW